MLNFESRVLLLSGAAGGIAREIAKHFHAAGASVVLGDVDEAALHDFAASLDPQGERTAVVRMDASQPADIQRIVDTAAARFGGIDFLVPAAAIYPERLVKDITDEEWRRVMSINLDGVFSLTRQALPVMRAGGSIVNLTSMAGHRGSFSHAHYSASKGALIAFTRSLALETGPTLRVNAVSPGIIATPMTEKLLDAKGAQLLASTPMQRYGKPAEIASVVAFLCSDMASFVHGEVIHVNGGLFMAG
ncbi:SDR family NAD(P)-dependent oxidoreductase [Burkholderia anthina]|uniref:SDR family NAD(P)-dependent oxidoreductase n=1 Tax=Burkholderia anthina TaxID=179879 RepID=UPI00158C61C5|nr:SDR family NAD(P)-dependent oxidoreductase [Burkholderia anthina]